MSRDTPRLSERERNIIKQLLQREKYGLELVEDSGGTLKRNAIYVVLSRMEDKGLISGRNVDAPKGSSGPPRRIYRVTGHGARALYAAELALGAWRGAR